MSMGQSNSINDLSDNPHLTHSPTNQYVMFLLLNSKPKYWTGKKSPMLSRKLTEAIIMNEDLAIKERNSFDPVFNWNLRPYETVLIWDIMEIWD